MVPDVVVGGLAQTSSGAWAFYIWLYQCLVLQAAAGFEWSSPGVLCLTHESLNQASAAHFCQWALFLLSAM